jgi:hypothetical protein
MSPFSLCSISCLLCLWHGLQVPIEAAEQTKGHTEGKPHWAFRPIQPPSVPTDAASVIDYFIKEKLTEQGLQPSPAADRATLIRRLSFDLIGLPPSPAEIKAFVEDASPRAYEHLVERLLASPQYGERWGRHWLDVARFAESDGFEYDRLRPNAWGYRDYVIQSFNQDKPYDRFMQEQVAGDVMAPVTIDRMIAPSLLVCGPWDAAAAIQANVTQRMIAREDEMEDLVSVVGQTFLGLTVNCARCHDHKSDPIPQVDYYRLKSVFEGVKHGERSIMDDAEQKERQAALALLDQSLDKARRQISEVEALGAQRLAKEHPDKPQEIAPTALARWTFAGAPLPMNGELKAGAKLENGLLKLVEANAFYQSDNITKEIREKTLEAWVSLASLEQRGGAVISLEGERGIFDAIVFGERQPKRWMAGSNSFVRTVDQPLPEETAVPGTFVQMAIVYRADNSIQIYRNGAPLGPAYTPASPLQTFPAGTAHVLLGLRHNGAGNGFLKGDIQHAALYDRALGDAEIATSFRAGNGGAALADVLAKLTQAEQSSRDSALAEMKRLEKSRDELRAKQSRVSYVGTRVEPAVTKLLKRGEVTSPAEVVTPGGLSAIAALAPDFGLPADAPEAARRLKFAAWLADPKNYLPARVMANRVWHWHFAQGLVATPNDIGVSGARPTHPELLDWLAAKFMESGWSVKALHRLIVNSATYQQASTHNAKAAGVDAENQWLWRYAPRRLEAEAVRDSMLAVSGQLNLQMGGPSFRPFTITEFNAAFYHLVDHAEPEFNRRTIYRININSAKDPLLDTFDCPDPSVKTPRRGVTTTPLQALELMNNPFVQRQAYHLAQRAQQAARQDSVAAIQQAYQLALGRLPTPEETKAAFAAAAERGLRSVCWSLLNSTEFLYVK